MGIFPPAVWAQRPVTPAVDARPVTSVSVQRPQTPVVERPQTSAQVMRPNTAGVERPQTTARVDRPVTAQTERPQTTQSAVYPQTTVEVLHPQTTAGVLRPQTPGEKSAPQTEQPRIFSQGQASFGQATTSMSDFKPKPAKDFSQASKAAEMVDGSLALGNDTAEQAAKDAMAASHLRSGQRENVENANLKDNAAALGGLDKMLTDRAKVQQKK